MDKFEWNGMKFYFEIDGECNLDIRAHNSNKDDEHENGYFLMTIIRNDGKLLRHSNCEMLNGITTDKKGMIVIKQD